MNDMRIQIAGCQVDGQSDFIYEEDDRPSFAISGHVRLLSIARRGCLPGRRNVRISTSTDKLLRALADRLLTIAEIVQNKSVMP